MKIVFFGGGGLRTLGLSRLLLQFVPDLKSGEIALCDRDAARLEAMGRMI